MGIIYPSWLTGLSKSGGGGACPLWPHRFRRPWCGAIDEWITYPPLLPLDPTMKLKYCRTKSNLNFKTFFFLIEFRSIYLILKVWKDFCMKSDQIKIELQCEIQRALTPTKSVSPFCYTYCITNLIWEGGEKFNTHKKCNQYETKKYMYRIGNFSYIFFACVILIIALVTR